MKDGAAPRNNTKDLLRPQAVDALDNECRGNEEVSKTQTHNFLAQRKKWATITLAAERSRAHAAHA